MAYTSKCGYDTDAFKIGSELCPDQTCYRGYASTTVQGHACRAWNAEGTVTGNNPRVWNRETKKWGAFGGTMKGIGSHNPSSTVYGLFPPREFISFQSKLAVSLN